MWEETHMLRDRESMSGHGHRLWVALNGLRSHALANRAVSGLDDVSAVLSHIAAGMGLGQNDVDAAVNAAHQKIDHAE